MKRVYLAVSMFILAGCATSPEITAWNMAKEVNTPAAYQDFIKRHPNSGHIGEASELAGKSKMDQIMNASTVAECVRTMKADPDPKTAAAVADLAYKAAQKEASIEDLYDFLAYFKGHRGAPDVRSRLEAMEFKSASGDASPVPMEYFLFKYPESRFSTDGRKLFAEKSYKQVKAWANQYGFKAFIEKFPESSHVEEIRSLIKATTITHSDTRNITVSLDRAIDNSPWLKRYGCALTLSSGIRAGKGDVDSLRYDLYKLEKETGSAGLPGCCSSVTLVVRPGAGEAVAEALPMLAKTEERRKELASIWEVYRQRDVMARTAADTSTKVADDLETAELSEDVLGRGPLGGMDVGREKGSMTARKAFEHFKVAGKNIERDRDEIKRLLLQIDGLYRPLKLYLGSYLIAE